MVLLLLLMGEDGEREFRGGRVDDDDDFIYEEE
jgi:hypothetical protein